MTHDLAFLEAAVKQAALSLEQGGFPAGALIVKDNVIIGQGISIGTLLHDPTSHGEMAAIRAACQSIKSTDLSSATLYASLHPCLMCLAAAGWANISRIVYACDKHAYYGGALDRDAARKTLPPSIEIIHLPALEEESLRLVRQWEESNLS